MLKKTVTYEDYDGQTQSSVFHFNLTKAELLLLETTSFDGQGFKATIERAIETNNPKTIVESMQKVLDLSYGVRTAEGGFLKTPENLAAFKASPAYSELFMELATDGKAAAEFVNAILPKIPQKPPTS